MKARNFCVLFTIVLNKYTQERTSSLHTQAIFSSENIFFNSSVPFFNYYEIKCFNKEVVKTTILEQDPPCHKIDGGLCLHPLP